MHFLTVVMCDFLSNCVCDQQMSPTDSLLFTDHKGYQSFCYSFKENVTFLLL